VTTLTIISASAKFNSSSAKQQSFFIINFKDCAVCRQACGQLSITAIVQNGHDQTHLLPPTHFSFMILILATFFIVPVLLSSVVKSYKLSHKKRLKNKNFESSLQIL